MQFLAAYIMKGRMQAMTVASTLALLSLLFLPISIVSSATIALVTLRKGWREGLYVLICGCLTAALLSMLLLGDYQFALTRLVLWLWLPVWLIAIILREGRQLSLALEISVLLGVVGVLAFYGIQPQPVEFWRNLLDMLLPMMLEAQPDAPADMFKRFADMISHYMTGGFAAISVYILVFGLFLARWWQAKLYNPGGFRSEYLGLQGRPHLAIGTLLLIALASLTSGQAAEVSMNMLVVLFVFYTFTGMALLHCSFAVMKGGRWMVPTLYITLLSIPHMMLLIALCGLGDTWLNLRNKLKPNGA